MAGTRECNAAVTVGLLSNAVEFYSAAVHLEDDMPNAAGDLFVDGGIAASDIICCVRRGVHSSSGTHSEAVALLEAADKGSGKHLNTLLVLKNKAAYTHQALSETVGPHQEMAARRDRPSAPADRVAAMIADRAPRARVNHGTAQLATGHAA